MRGRMLQMTDSVGVLLTGSHVTRFIALASVGNASKQKFLHALGLVPAADMDTAALATQPPNTTPSPYEQASRKRQHEADSGNEQVRPVGDICSRQFC